MTLLCGLLVLLAATYVGLSSLAALDLTCTVRRPLTRSPEELGLAYEVVTFHSRAEAVRLEGWLLAPAEGWPAQRPVVLVHGHNQNREGEVHGRVLEIAAALVRRGRPVLAFDLRGCGRSDGNRFTLGAKEAGDVGGAVDYLVGRGLAADGVNVLSYSMGAAASLLLAPTEPGVRAVAEDSGYAVLAEILEEQVPRASGLPGIFTRARS